MLEKRLIYLLASIPFQLLIVVLGTLQGSTHFIVAGIGWGPFNFGFIFGSYVEKFVVEEEDLEESETEILECEAEVSGETLEELSEDNGEGESAAEETKPEAAPEAKPEEEKSSD